MPTVFVVRKSASGGSTVRGGDSLRGDALIFGQGLNFQTVIPRRLRTLDPALQQAFSYGSFTPIVEVFDWRIQIEPPAPKREVVAY